MEVSERNLELGREETYESRSRSSRDGRKLRSGRESGRRQSWGALQKVELSKSNRGKGEVDERRKEPKEQERQAIQEQEAEEWQGESA